MPELILKLNPDDFMLVLAAVQRYHKSAQTNAVVGAQDAPAVGDIYRKQARDAARVIALLDSQAQPQLKAARESKT